MSGVVSTAVVILLGAPSTTPPTKKKATSAPRVRPALKLVKPAPTKVEVKAKVRRYKRTDLPAFKIDLRIDIPVIVIFGSLTAGWLLPIGVARCAREPVCDKSELWSIDKPAAGLFDKKWGLGSDLTLAAIGLGAVITLFADEGWKNGLNDLLVLLETFVVANGFTIIVAMASRRPRPLLYGTEASTEERLRSFNSQSFWSGHTASAFAITFGLFNTIWRRKPNSALAWAVFSIGIAASSLVAVGRVMAGRHFPTDVIVGALVGSGIGFLIPALHARPKLTVRPVIAGKTAGVAFVW